MEPSARFDDAATGVAFELHGLRGELVADRCEGVPGVLAEVERHARQGKWVGGYVGYEAAAGLDAALPRGGAPDGQPYAWFGVWDDRVPVGRRAPPASTTWALELTEAAHAAGVAAIRRRIAAGDVYQVNLTARAHGLVDDPAALYEAMVDAQRGRYSALLTTPTHAVVCASPELLFERRGDTIVTRPMKGTARRGRWSEEDEDRAAALRCSPKERAENVMIVDLVRHDLGRVAAYGSVQVPDLFTAEPYPTVWQLTSTVTARLRPGVGLVDVFRAVFPPGSVTGAPKRSAMQTIAAVEDTPRGVYCGAVGYATRDHDRFAVAIRTATVALETGRAQYGVGGGITWGSDPAAEWSEVLAKMTVLGAAPDVPALFETMRVDGRVRNLERHLDRMEASARRFAIPFDRAAASRAATAERAESRLRLELAPDGTLSVERTTAPPFGDDVRLAWGDEPVWSGDVRLFHKTTDRSAYERRRATHPEADDVILCNERGEVTETTTANLVVELDGRWWTPPIDSGLLPGVERARLLDEGVVAERVLTPRDLEAATRVAVVSSLRGWRHADVAGRA